LTCYIIPKKACYMQAFFIDDLADKSSIFVLL